MESAQLRASRRGYRAHLTRVFGKIASILDSDEPPNERETATLQTSLEQIETTRATVAELDTKIQAAITDADALESEILDTQEVTYNVAEKITFIKAVLARPRPLNVQAPPFHPQTPGVQASASVMQPQNQPPAPANLSDGNEHQSVTEPRTLDPAQAQGYVNSFNISQNVSRLPKLTLPTFEGDPLKWQTFWDSFESAVDTNDVLTDIQKLNYLRAHLEGEAARAVAGFPLTSANYQQSLDVLRERFGEQQRVINAHMHALMNLPHANNSMTSLRTFCDSIENHVRGLTALGQSSESYGALLVPMILGKLPTDVRKNLAREHSHLEWTLDQLRQSIAKERSWCLPSAITI